MEFVCAKLLREVFRYKAVYRRKHRCICEGRDDQTVHGPLKGDRGSTAIEKRTKDFASHGQ